MNNVMLIKEEKSQNLKQQKENVNYVCVWKTHTHTPTHKGSDRWWKDIKTFKNHIPQGTATTRISKIQFSLGNDYLFGSSSLLFFQGKTKHFPQPQGFSIFRTLWTPSMSIEISTWAVPHTPPNQFVIKSFSDFLIGGACDNFLFCLPNHNQLFCKLSFEIKKIVLLCH